MKFLVRLIVASALCLVRPATPACVAAGDPEWEVTLNYGKNMSARWLANSGQAGSAVWCFSAERNEVAVLGTQADRGTGSNWPCWGDQDRLPSADVMLMVTLSAERTEANSVSVNGQLKRWRRVDAGQPTDYRAEFEHFERTVAIGVPWTLVVGHGSDGKAYALQVTVQPAGTTRQDEDHKAGISLPVEFRYVMRCADIAGDSVFQLAKTATLQLDPESRDGVLGHWKVSLEHPRRDLYFEVKLNDIQLQSPSGSNNQKFEATFVMNRVLCLNPVTTGDTTTVTGEHTVLSSIERRLTLTPAHAIQLEISSPVEGDILKNSRESVELRPLSVGKAGNE